RPELARQGQKSVRNVPSQSHRLLDRIHQDRKSFILRTALYLKNPLDGRQIKRIGAKSVESVCRDANYPPALDETCGVINDIALGGFRRDFEDFDRQWLTRSGLRRTSYHGKLSHG